MNNYQRGKWAEMAAALYLRLHGYRIIARNIRGKRGSPGGEIDLIALHKKCLVFVEIKERKTLENAAYAISLRQQKRLLCGAQTFIQHHPQYTGFDMRFDALLIAFPWHFQHLQNAWSA